jgi:hypothetical protein
MLVHDVHMIVELWSFCVEVDVRHDAHQLQLCYASGALVDMTSNQNAPSTKMVILIG